MLLSLAKASGTAMASEVTSVQTPEESDEGKESTNNLKYPKVKRKKMNWIVLLMGLLNLQTLLLLKLRYLK